MDFDEQFNLGHLLLDIRKCRVCGERKILLMDTTEQEKIEDQ